MSHVSNFSATDIADVVPASRRLQKAGPGANYLTSHTPRQKLCLGMENLWEGKEKVGTFFFSGIRQNENLLTF